MMPCDTCDGKGWLLFPNGAIQRCDMCQKYKGDLEAADASGLEYKVISRKTGEPCIACLENDWEAMSI